MCEEVDGYGSEYASLCRNLCRTYVIVCTDVIDWCI